MPEIFLRARLFACFDTLSCFICFLHNMRNALLRFRTWGQGVLVYDVTDDADDANNFFKVIFRGDLSFVFFRLLT